MASKRGLRRRQCGRKKAMTNEQAMLAVTLMGHRKPGQSFDAYRCSNCGGDVWHVGHRTNKVRQQIKSKRMNK